MNEGLAYSCTFGQVGLFIAGDYKLHQSLFNIFILLNEFRGFWRELGNSILF